MRFRSLPLLFLTAFVLSACSAPIPAQTLSVSPTASLASQTSLAVQTPSAVQSAAALPFASALETGANPGVWERLSHWEYPSYDPPAAVKIKKAGQIEIVRAQQKQVKHGDYSYFFDTENPVSVEGTAEFPLCRAKGAGQKENLGVTGFSFVWAGDFLYVSTAQSAGFDYAPFLCLRVKTDGSKPVCIGESLAFYAQAKSPYLYFTDLSLPTDDLALYRADFGFTGIEKLSVVLPDWADIQKKAQPCYRFIYIQKVTDTHIQFAFRADDADTTARYFGFYQVPVNGGDVQKTDSGKYYPAYTE
jgi:hypothetical protein